jgi:hypothetical protein
MGLRTAVIGTAGASAARVVEPVLGPSHFSTPWCGMMHGASARGNAWREGQGEVWRPGPARRCSPTRDGLSKRRLEMGRGKAEEGAEGGGGGGEFLYRRMSSIGAPPALPHVRV